MHVVETETDKRTKYLLLVAILGLLFGLKLLYPAGSGPYGVDANYFYQIARHVSEGEGLQTSVSIYHEGMRELPGPTRVYPLWPLLLGWVGSMTSMQAATRLLPPFLYILDLLLLYVLSERLASRLGLRQNRSESMVTAGHAVVLIFGTNRLFFTATSHPYTEGLAFALAFAALLALDRWDSRRGWRWVGAAGGLAGLAFLARSQMAIIGASIMLVVVWYFLRNKRGFSLVVAFAVGLVLPVMLWYVYLATIYPLSALNPFAGINPFFQYRETAEIAPFVAWVPVEGVSGWLRDRLPGVLVALNPRNPMSYFASFGAVVALIPLVLIRIRRFMPSFFPSNSITIPSVVLAGLLFQVTLLHFHATFFLPWLFGWRHGLPLILLLIPVVIILSHDRSPVVRVLAVTVIVLSIVTGLFQIGKLISAPRLEPTMAERQFAQWIDNQRDPAPILTTGAPALGMLTEGVYHWTLCSESADQTRAMLENLPINLVLVYESELGCPFIHDLLTEEVEPIRAFGPPGQRLLLFRWREQEVDSRSSSPAVTESERRRPEPV